MYMVETGPLEAALEKYLDGRSPMILRIDTHGLFVFG